MTVTIRQLHPHFFGEVSGVDLRQPLTPQEAADIEAGMDKYAVLVFRDQDITDDQQLAFSPQFRRPRECPRRPCHQARRQRGSLPDSPTSPISARTASRCRATTAPICSTSATGCGTPTVRSGPMPAKFSLLSARVVNPKGGNTEFADMRAAYDALDDATKAEIEDLVCEHSLIYSRGIAGLSGLYRGRKADVQAGAAAPGAHASGARAQVAVSVVAYRRHRRLADAGGAGVHPRPDRARDAAGIRLCPQMAAHDLVMWDNRQTMHRVRRYDQSQPRDMRRTTVAGTMPTVAQQAAE